MILFIKQMVQFGIVGFANTLIGLTAIWMLVFFHVPPLLANLGGYIVGVTFSYLVHSAWTFASRSNLEKKSLRNRRSALRYVAAFCVAWCANAAVLSVALATFPTRLYLAQVPGLFIYSTVFFLLCKYFVFRETTK